MNKAKLFNLAGEEKGEVKLNSKIFDIVLSPKLMHQVVVAYANNSRTVYAHTKGKGEVRGGGKKPWAQKGTGRARHGSIRSPLWRGGGIIFGPRAQVSYGQKINKQMKKKAMFMALSDKASNNQILALEELSIDKPQAKTVAKFLKAVKLNSVLFVIAKMDKNIVGSVRNLSKTNVMSANSLNAFDVLKYKNIIFTQDALQEAEKVFLKK
jgi:large subunit ribosomal protein L4